MGEPQFDFELLICSSEIGTAAVDVGRFVAEGTPLERPKGVIAGGVARAGSSKKAARQPCHGLKRLRRSGSL